MPRSCRRARTRSCRDWGPLERRPGATAAKLDQGAKHGSGGSAAVPQQQGSASGDPTGCCSGPGWVTVSTGCERWSERRGSRASLGHRIRLPAQQTSERHGAPVNAGGATGQTGSNNTIFGNSGVGGQNFGGGAIVGVASKSKDPTIRMFNKKKKYDEWVFIYSPMLDQQNTLLRGPYNGQTHGRSNSARRLGN